MNAIPHGADAWRPALSIEGLTVARGGRAVLRGVSTTFGEGTVTAVVGPSGVGKTTLMNVLSGLVVPQSGLVAVEGLGGLGEPGVLREMRRRTAMVFQDHALIGRLSAIDNVLLGLADTRHPLTLLPWPRAARERAALALADVGLLARANARTDTLSGGERQRVGIARALVRAPRLILGDEPFASVDPALARRLGGELRRLVLRDGLTAVLVLHQLQLARALADHIVGLSGGRIAFDGPASAFDADAEASVFSAPAPTGDRDLPPEPAAPGSIRGVT